MIDAEGKPSMTRDERASANEELLHQLGVLKRAHGEASRRDLLQNPEISKIVNTLITVNEPWIDNRVRLFRHGRDFDEAKSLALTGPGNGVQGIMGAILECDPERGALTGYLAQAIHHALTHLPGEKRRAESFISMNDDDADGKPISWVDRHQPRPEKLVISDELMGVLQEAIRNLPENRRWIAGYIVQHVLETGERPAIEQIAERLGVSKQRGAQVVQDTFAKLQAEIERTHPGLAEDGIGGWKEFSAAFGKGHRLRAGVGV